MNTIRLLIIGLISFVCWSQNTTITGYFVDQQQRPISNVRVAIPSQATVVYSNQKGFFTLSTVDVSTVILNVSHPTYVPVQIPVNVTMGNVELSQWVLRQQQEVIDELPIVDFDAITATSLAGASVNFGSQLRSRRTVFLEALSFQFSSAFFSARGLARKHQSLRINGIPMQNFDTGNASWAHWGGLNDITNRSQTVQYGVAPFGNYFAGLLGGVELFIRPSTYRQGNKFSQAFSNRTYRYRTMFSSHSGTRANGWSYSGLLSLRHGNNGFLFDQHIKISDTIIPIIPKELDLSQVDETQIGQWVKFSNVQFTLASLGKTFSGEEMDQFDGERRLVQCIDQRSLLMSTSTFADFKSILLPEGGGEIQGILTKDFFGEKPILKINSPQDISFEHTRCDPFFEENFEEVRMGLFEKEGWLNVNQSGSQFWEVYEDENSLGQSIAIGSYRSGDATTISYLITPVIDVSSLSNPFLAFRSSTRFADNSILEFFYTTDWEGEMTFIEEHLKELPVRLASNSDDSTHWIDSGDIPIDFGPRFRLIFRYTGSGKTASDGTYELDDIRVFTKE